MTYYQQQQPYRNGNGKLVTAVFFVSNHAHHGKQTHAWTPQGLMLQSVNIHQNQGLMLQGAFITIRPDAPKCQTFIEIIR